MLVLKELKKNLVALGLATSIPFSVMGCGENDCSVSQNGQISSLEEQTDLYETEDYYFIYLDNQVYCTTREKVFSEYKEWDRFYVKAYEYYEVNSGSLVGVVIEDLPQVQDDWRSNIWTGYCYDYCFCNGEYGFGKIIPRQAVIPVSDFFPNRYCSQEELDFLSSKSQECKESILDSLVFSYRDCKDFFEVKQVFGDTVYEKSYTQQVSLTEFLCQTKDGVEETFLGYRCSYDTSSKGYQYVYNILTGSIHYIGKTKENSFANVIENPLKKVNEKSVSELQREFVLLNEVTENQSSFNHTEELVSAKDIYILDTNDNHACYISREGNVKKYYVLMNTSQINDELPYKDLVNEGSAHISQEGSLCTYISDDYSEVISTDYYPAFSDDPNLSNPLKTLDEFLIAHEMEDFIHENGQYQMSELMEIVSYIDSLNYEMERKLSNDYE